MARCIGSDNTSSTAKNSMVNGGASFIADMGTLLLWWCRYSRNRSSRVLKSSTATSVQYCRKKSVYERHVEGPLSSSLSGLCVDKPLSVLSWGGKMEDEGEVVMLLLHATGDVDWWLAGGVGMHDGNGMLRWGKRWTGGGETAANTSAWNSYHQDLTNYCLRINLISLIILQISMTCSGP